MPTPKKVDRAVKPKKVDNQVYTDRTSILEFGLAWKLKAVERSKGGQYYIILTPFRSIQPRGFDAAQIPGFSYDQYILTVAEILEFRQQNIQCKGDYVEFDIMRLCIGCSVASLHCSIEVRREYTRLSTFFGIGINLSKNHGHGHIRVKLSLF
jgi:hypothetical protein